MEKTEKKETLINSYYNSMKLAKKNNLHSISFPAISAGVYGYPKDEACKVAVDTTLKFMAEEDYTIDVSFILFDKENFERYIKYIANL